MLILNHGILKGVGEPPVTPPDTPTGLTVENDGLGGLNVNWNASDGATYYEYQRNINGGLYGAWTNNGSSTYAYLGGFTNGQEVCVRVRACNTGGCSFQSFAVCVVIGNPE